MVGILKIEDVSKGGSGLSKKFIVSTIIPLIILIGMTLLPVTTLLFGDEITLATKPVDPRDLFRGDYVILNYEVSDIDINKFPEVFEGLQEEQEQYEALEKLRNKSVYVVLKESETVHTVNYVTLKRPKEGIFLKGKANHYWLNRDPDTGQATISLDYSLDKFFVPENTGLRLEELSREGQLIARVKILRGYSVLTDVEPKQGN